MAIYHCSVKVIGRSAGRSAIASAAYRSGSKLYSEETDHTFDYSRKGGVVHSEIALCANAPERFLDRQTLWNSVQSIENKSDSRLAREIEVALPIECNKKEWIEIGREYAAYMTEQGMIADWSIHNPKNKETGECQNPHIHMMVTTRPIKENGEWGAKEKKAYKLDDKGQKIPIIDPKTGEQKIGAKGRKMWQREVVDATGWDNRGKIYEWREKWSEVVNKHLEPEKQIDHRSYKDQGIDRIPTVHEGFAVQKIDKKLMEEKGEHADIVQLNLDIKEQNKLISLIKNIGKEVIEKARAVYEGFREYTRTRGSFDPAGRELNPVTGRELDAAGLEQQIKRREPEIIRIAEAIRNRSVARMKPKLTEAQKRDVEILKMPLYTEKREVIPAKYSISGSNGTNYNALYKAIGEAVINTKQIGKLRRVDPKMAYGRPLYDCQYIGEVFIIKPSHQKKSEKILDKAGIKYVAVPVKYGKKDMIAMICDDLKRDYCEEKLKYEDSFYMYIDYTAEKESVIRERRPYTSQELAEQAEERARERQKEAIGGQGTRDYSSLINGRSSLRSKLAEAEKIVKEKEAKRAKQPKIEEPSHGWDR